VNTWDKVTLTWDCHLGLRTSIAENGDFDAEVSKDYSQHGRHDLHEMSAFSVHAERGDQRRGVMNLHIKQSHNVDTAVEAIVKRFESAFAKLTDGPNAVRQYGIHIETPKDKSWIDGKFTLSFVLADREQFCDQAIVIARAVLEALGIEDSKGYRLADFSLKRESFVMIDGSWITFVRWLRMSHRLPIFDTKDMLSEIR
jgi:hypothetical protein